MWLAPVVMVSSMMKGVRDENLFMKRMIDSIKKHALQNTSESGRLEPKTEQATRLPACLARCLSTPI